MTLEEVLKSNSKTGTKIVLCSYAQVAEIEKMLHSEGNIVIVDKVGVKVSPNASVNYNFVRNPKSIKYACWFLNEYIQLAEVESLLKTFCPLQGRVIFLIDTPAFASITHNVVNWSNFSPFNTQNADDNLAKYADYTPTQWALMWIERYGQIDGAHHKQWVLDQVARILNGTPILFGNYTFPNGSTEERFQLGEPSEKYKQWVIEMKDGEDGPDTYGYDEGVAP